MNTDQKVLNLLQLAIQGNDLAIGIFKIYNLSIVAQDGHPSDLQEIKRQLREVCKKEQLEFKTMYNRLGNKYDAIVEKENK